MTFSGLAVLLLPTLIVSIASSLQPQQKPRSHQKNINKSITQYTNYWDNLLLEEHRQLVEELRERRKTWSRERLVSSGTSIFNAIAEPDSELWGDKIVRIYVPEEKRLHDKFTRGDVLVLTPNEGDRIPRECLVVDVGKDWLTVGVGPTWPKGLYEMRKLPGSYRVRLDRTAPGAPLKAQRYALSQLSKGRAGEVAALLANLFLSEDPTEAKLLTSQLSTNVELKDGNREDIFEMAMKDAVSGTPFEPNESQCSAIQWALQRRLSLIRGPPGTGKTRVGAALIASFLKLQQFSKTGDPCRVLAVTHSNGAADVLLEALLQLNVPAVRLGRPASVSPTVQHRTIVAISEKMPEVIRLRQIAQNPVMHQQRRSAATFDVKQYMAEAQRTIVETAPVIVTSCIGAHQLVAADEAKSLTFRLLVVDEAAQTTEPALVCALAAARAEQAVLVGDTQQLPPTVATSSPEIRNKLGISPMARLETLGIGQITLRVQYRMSPALLEHPSSYFYGGLVRCANDVPDGPPPVGFPWPAGLPLAFVQVGTASEIAHSFGGRSNPEEVAVVGRIAKELLGKGEITADEVAIISPYSKQVQLLRTELSMDRNTRDICVGTVDSFQGQETGVVIFSAVRSNPMAELGFLRDRRRLCVAITRARRGLILVGDAKVLRTCRHWAALLESLEKRGCLIRAGDLLRRDQQVEHEVAVSNRGSFSVEEALDDLLGGSDDNYDVFISDSP